MKRTTNVKFRKNFYLDGEVIFEAIEAPKKYSGILMFQNAPAIEGCKLFDWLCKIPNWESGKVKNIKVIFEYIKHD